jgi:hypothetical protein
MSPTMTNPARAQAAGLGNVVHGQAIDARVNGSAVREPQTHWLVNWFHVRPVLAAAIACLAFEGARQ